MICMVRAGEGEFAFRTAYDEDLAKFGPGVEVFVDAMQQFERSTDGAGSTRAPHRATGTSWGCSPTVTS
jgi:hypothetical protein